VTGGIETTGVRKGRKETALRSAVTITGRSGLIGIKKSKSLERRGDATQRDARLTDF
jgi:hypothetical protein